MKVTNLVLLISLVLTLLLIGLAILSGASGSSPASTKFLVSVIIISLLALFAYRRIEKNINDRDKFWLKPITAKTGVVIINSVILLWQGAVIALICVMSKVSASIEFTSISFAVVVLALLAGRFFRRRLSSESLLAYGLSFFGALLIVLLLFVNFSKHSKF